MTTATGDYAIDFKVLADVDPYTNTDLIFINDTARIDTGQLQSSWTTTGRLMFCNADENDVDAIAIVEKKNGNDGAGECGPARIDTLGNGYELKINFDELRIHRCVNGARSTALGPQVNLTYPAGSLFSIQVLANGNILCQCNGTPIAFGTVNDTTFDASTLQCGGFSDRETSGQSGTSSFAVDGIAASASIDSVTFPLLLGMSGIITTSGMGALTSFTISGKAVSSLSGSAGSSTFNIPLWADGVQGFKLGAGQTGLASDGTLSASTSAVTIGPENTHDYIELTSVNTSAGYLGAYYSLNIGDQIKFPTADTLAVTTNYIDVDGGIYTDYTGSQVIHVRNVTTGIVTQITLINGVVAIELQASAQSVSTATASLSTQTSLSASAISVSTSTAVLSTNISLSANAESVSTSSANLTGGTVPAGGSRGILTHSITQSVTRKLTK